MRVSGLFYIPKEGWKIEEVKKILHGKTTVLAGPSGVGKSSLINLLQSEVMMETGSISRKIDKEGVDETFRTFSFGRR